MRRREFIIKGSMATLAATASTSILANNYGFLNSNKTVNVGIIGTGSRGGGLIPFAQGVENMNLIALCDNLPFRLDEGVKRAQSKVKAYSDYRKMLKNKNLDAVIIATPFHTHSEIAIDAMRAGKHVYAEKTLAKGYGPIEDILVESHKSSVTFQTGHQLHSSRLYVHIVDMIKKGEIGKVEAIEC